MRLERQIEKRLAAQQLSARAVVKWANRGHVPLVPDHNTDEGYFGICGALQIERPLVEITLTPRRRNRRQALRWCSTGTGASIVANVVRAGLGIHLAWRLVYEIPLGRSREYLVTPRFGEARFDATRAADGHLQFKDLHGPLNAQPQIVVDRSYGPTNTQPPTVVDRSYGPTNAQPPTDVDRSYGPTNAQPPTVVDRSYGPTNAQTPTDVDRSYGPTYPKDLNMAAEPHVDALTQARLRWLQAKGLIDPESAPHLWQEFTQFDVELTARHVQPDDLITAKAWNHIVNRIAALERFGASCNDSGVSSESSAFRTGIKRRRSADD
jgi:hypothetical protein